ncbi:MAG: hypothetical protein WKF73_00520 [Nocardioidaceae bacterium]
MSAYGNAHAELPADDVVSHVGLATSGDGTPCDRQSESVFVPTEDCVA